MSERRRLSPMAARLGIVVVTMVACAPVFAADPPEDLPLVSNIFYETDLRQALGDLSAQTGVVVVAAAEVSGYISCEFEEVPLDEALDIMLAGTGFAANWTGDFFFVASNQPTSPSFWQVGEPKRIPLKYLAAPSAQQMLPATLRPYVVPDPAGHCLSVFAPGQVIEKIESVLAEIDLPPRQIMLEARVVLLQKSGTARLGATYDWPQLEAGARTTETSGDIWSDIAWVATAGMTPAGELTNSLMVNLDLMAANDEATTVANPKVLAYEGQESRIAVLTEEYFKILTEDFYQRSTLEKVETGVVLKIIPRIGDAGDISMDIEIEVSDVVARGDQDLPVVTRRTTKSRTLVPDRGTVVISGLTDHRDRMSQKKVPILGDLPLIGRLFTSNSTSRQESQVAVFITPRIVEVPRPDQELLSAGNRRLPLVGESFDREIEEVLTRMKTDDSD